eukprot:g9603.t1
MRDRTMQSNSLLFLSTCWSQELAQVFVECGCPHVVSLRTRVNDIAARRFSQQFYLSLGRDWSLHGRFGQSDHFVLFGQHAADKATLQELCGEGQGMDAHLRMLEDAGRFLEVKMVPRPEHFLGRKNDIHEVMHHFTGVQSRRACALSGPEGIGKTALSVEFVHFAAAPGRHFSCGARMMRIEAMDLAGIANSLQEELDNLAAQLEVCLRPSTSDSSQTVPVDTFASECDEHGLVQMEDRRRRDAGSEGLGVFVKDPTEKQSLSATWTNFTGAIKGFDLVLHEVPWTLGERLCQMQGSFMWQTMQGYPYFDQWQAASSFISAFGGYDFVPKSGKRGRGKQDMWIAEKASTSDKRPPALGVDASDPRRIVWTLEKASLTSKNKDREKVSPSFRIPMGGQEVEFKLNLFATSVSSNRHCSSFKKAKGKGYVALRCVQSINDCTQPTLKFWRWNLITFDSKHPGTLGRRAINVTTVEHCMHCFRSECSG